MTLAKAIVMLRKKLQYTQTEFAEALQVKPVTISRYENGRQPRVEVVKRLAELADEAGSSHLRDLFEATWKGSVAAKVDNLPSSGAERRIPNVWLEVWRFRQATIFRACTGLIRKEIDLTPTQRTETLEHVRELAQKTWRDLRPFLTEPAEELDPNEDFSKEPLFSAMLLEEDWMSSLYGPPTVRPIEGRVGQRGKTGKDHE